MKLAQSLVYLYLFAATTLLAATKGKPNILVLFNDDQRADTIAALGNPHIKTPNLDRLVERGLSFNRAYMQGSFQPATCVPSRAMLLAGQNLFAADTKLMRDTTWPEAFSDAGYTTFISGKWHNGDPSLERSFQIGRSIFAGGFANPLRAKLSDIVDGKITDPEPSGQHACASFADATIRFIKEPKEGPFFAYIPFDGPHDPHIVPDDFPIHYDPKTIPLPPNYLPQHPWNNGEMTARDEKLLPWPRTEEDIRQMTADYWRYISYLDFQIGRILDSLEASPSGENTFVVFSSDSGVARGSHGLIGKQNLYEFDAIRVPLIIAGPGIPKGKRTEAMCYLYDLLPTLGKACSVESPNESDAFDFSATLADPSKPARDHLVFAYRKVQRAYMDQRWKLIRYPQVDRTQLFDLKNDPYEMENLANQPEQAARTSALTDSMADKLKALGDTDPLKIARPKPADWVPPQTTKGEKGDRSQRRKRKKE